MKAYTTIYKPGVTLANVAADPTARGKFIMFLAECSRRGWDLHAVDDANAGLHFIFHRDAPLPPVAGPMPAPPPPLPAYPN